METVKSLRQSGYKIKIIHHRLHGNADIEKFDWRGGILAKGGTTELFLISPEGIQVRAEAKCSNLDNYCRRTGVAISLGRALKELEFQRKLQDIRPKSLKEKEEINRQLYVRQILEAKEKSCMEDRKRGGFLEFQQ